MESMLHQSIKSPQQRTECTGLYRSLQTMREIGTNRNNLASTWRCCLCPQKMKGKITSSEVRFIGFGPPNAGTRARNRSTLSPLTSCWSDVVSSPVTINWNDRWVIDNRAAPTRFCATYLPVGELNRRLIKTMRVYFSMHFCPLSEGSFSAKFN